MASPHISSIRAVSDKILSVSGDLTVEVVSEACSVVLHEIDSSNAYIREFEGFPTGGPFSMVSLRIPRASSGKSPVLVTMTPRHDVQLTQVDLASSFTISQLATNINLHIPPEGTISFQQPHGNRLLVLQFTFQSRLLRMVAIHENP
jgi:hypothetical protein